MTLHTTTHNPITDPHKLNISNIIKICCRISPTSICFEDIPTDLNIYSYMILTNPTVFNQCWIADYLLK